MAHEIIFDETRQIYPMTFVGDTPWHGLGQRLEPGQPLEVWAEAAGMDWDILRSPLTFGTPVKATGRQNNRFIFPSREALIRSDNHGPLSIVSDKYQIVQPREVLEFFRDLTEAGGFTMNTAGVLFGGTKFWALAEIGAEARIMGQDKIGGFLLLGTSCDGSLATTAKFTSVRVVCNNTLSFAVDQDGAARGSVRIPHSRSFDPDMVKAELGLAQASFDSFIKKVNITAKRKVTDSEAMTFLMKCFHVTQEGEELTPEILFPGEAKTVKKCLELFKGDGKGSNLKSADGTAWGLVNAVTEFIDFHKNTRIDDTRFSAAMFGDTSNIKDKAFEMALELAA